ncbi:hypothetical protein B4N89_46175 [Embleya scabrispora]|uniref:Uncharacterized protein n=1 Tax=Embleya scabrispora TaxID=159449 RepID=A0A1T3NJ84_9ACTN|nr:hypothetical protein B4N89_46175 [Embleya scabrispora]
MSHEDRWHETDADRHDVWMYSGRPCSNCESEPAENGGHFCSDECKAEWEGADDTEDGPHTP